MKNTLRNSALLAAAATLMSTSTSVFAATEPSVAKSTGDVEFLPKLDPTAPVDPTDPDNPNPNNPIDPDDPNNPGTGNKGPLSLDYVSNISFGKAFVNPGNDLTLNAVNNEPFVQVSDWRVESGWGLSVALTTPFTIADGDTKGTILKGAQMNWKGATAKSTKDNSSKAPTTSDFVLGEDGASANVMGAAKSGNVGKGTWVSTWSNGKGNVSDEKPDANGQVMGNNDKITLNVPRRSAIAGKYVAELTWTLTDTPAA